MHPSKIPFNALIVGPTNSCKAQYLLKQLRGPFRGQFDYIMLLCPTVLQNKTYFGLLGNESHVICPEQHEVDQWLSIASLVFENTSTLIVLDEYAASKDMKGFKNQLVSLGFSLRHSGIGVWVLTHQTTSIVKPFRENMAAFVLFYTSSTTTAIFEDYAGDLSPKEYRDLLAYATQKIKFSHIVFSPRHPYGIEPDSTRSQLFPRF